MSERDTTEHRARERVRTLDWMLRVTAHAWVESVAYHDDLTPAQRRVAEVVAGFVTADDLMPEIGFESLRRRAGVSAHTAHKCVRRWLASGHLRRVGRAPGRPFRYALRTCDCVAYPAEARLPRPPRRGGKEAT